MNKNKCFIDIDGTEMILIEHRKSKHGASPIYIFKYADGRIKICGAGGMQQIKRKDEDNAL